MVVSMPAPFRGREAQMATLDEQLDRAQSGGGAVILVEGEAGIGEEPTAGGTGEGDALSWIPGGELRR